MLFLELKKKSLLVGDALLSLIIGQSLGGVSLSWLGGLLGSWRWIGTDASVGLLVGLKI